MPTIGKLARKAYGKTAKNMEGSMPSETTGNSFLLNAAVILFHRQARFFLAKRAGGKKRVYIICDLIKFEKECQ
jgi:hypothetical protein